RLPPPRPSPSPYTTRFRSMAPASNPHLVAVVVVRGPQGAYFGTAVAAPVFQAVMRGALRLLDIAPDKVDPELVIGPRAPAAGARSEEHTSELQSRFDLVCR